MGGGRGEEVKGGIGSFTEEVKSKHSIFIIYQMVEASTSSKINMSG